MDVSTHPDALDEAAFEALRDVEVEWLSATLAASISNLGYPVGCGNAPNPEHLKAAAVRLFDRYLQMLRLARCALVRPDPDEQIYASAHVMLAALRRAKEEAVADEQDGWFADVVTAIQAAERAP